VKSAPSPISSFQIALRMSGVSAAPTSTCSSWKLAPRSSIGRPLSSTRPERLTRIERMPMCALQPVEARPPA
jgi:hypothetical protein